MFPETAAKTNPIKKLVVVLTSLLILFIVTVSIAGCSPVSEQTASTNNETANSDSYIATSQLADNNSKDNTAEYTNDEYMHDLELYMSNMLSGIKSFNNSAELMAKVKEKNTPEYFAAKQELSDSALSLAFAQDILNPNIVPPPDYEELHKKVVSSANCFYSVAKALFEIEAGTSTDENDKLIASQMQEGLTCFSDVAVEYDKIANNKDN